MMNSSYSSLRVLYEQPWYKSQVLILGLGLVSFGLGLGLGLGSWSCKLWSWSWSCCSGLGLSLGLKTLVLFRSLPLAYTDPALHDLF